MSAVPIYLIGILCILAMATTAEARWPLSAPDPTQVCAERAERLARAIEAGAGWGYAPTDRQRDAWIKGKTYECLAAQLKEPIR
jgi:hypothetical protein